MPVFAATAPDTEDGHSDHGSQACLDIEIESGDQKLENKGSRIQKGPDAFQLFCRDSRIFQNLTGRKRKIDERQDSREKYEDEDIFHDLAEWQKPVGRQFLRLVKSRNEKLPELQIQIDRLPNLFSLSFTRVLLREENDSSMTLRFPDC